MYRRELNVTVVLETVKESKKLVTAISESVGPVSSTIETLTKVDVFLKEMEKEIVQSLPEEKRASRYKRFFVIAPLLMPAAKLLIELLAEAKKVIEQFLR